MTYTSRAATVDDAPFIVALHATDHARGFVRAAPAEARIRERHDDPRYEHRIVVSGGDPVGFYLLRSDEPWFVEAALVLTIAPRRGIGTYMLREIVRRAFAERRAHRLYVETHEDNIAMRALLVREGFTYEGTFRHGTIVVFINRVAGACSSVSKRFEKSLRFGKIAISR